MRIAEPPRADARPAARDKAPDRADRTAAFDNALAEVQGEAGQPKPITTASARPPSKASTPVAATKNDTRAGAAGARDSSIESSDVELASVADAPDGSGVSALLKRFKAKEEPIKADTPADGGAAKFDPILVAPLLSSSRAAAPVPDTGQDAKASAAYSTPLLGDRSLETASTGPMGKIISDVSLATHVAPTKGAPTPARAADDEAGSATVPDVAGVPVPVPAQPGNKVFADTAVVPRATNADNADPDSSAGQHRADGNGKVAEALPTYTSGDPDTSSGERAPHDRGTERLAAEPVDNVSSPPSSVISTQTPIKRIAAAVADMAGHTATAAQAPEPAATAQVAPVRTVTLQMSPANLGTVEVRLHLTGQGLDLQLTISERETLGLVTRERDALTSALQSQSYEIHSLVIQDGSSSAPSGGTHVAKHDSSGDRPANHHGRESPDGHTGEGREGNERGRQNPFRPRDEGSRARVADERSLFI